MNWPVVTRWPTQAPFESHNIGNFNLKTIPVRYSCDVLQFSLPRSKRLYRDFDDFFSRSVHFRCDIFRFISLICDNHLLICRPLPPPWCFYCSMLNKSNHQWVKKGFCENEAIRCKFFVVVSNEFWYSKYIRLTYWIYRYI